MYFYFWHETTSTIAFLVKYFQMHLLSFVTFRDKIAITS